MSEHRVYIISTFSPQHSVFTSWTKDLTVPYKIVDEYLPDWEIPADAGAIVTHLHYRWEELAGLRKLVEQNKIPVLILIDGILEYRNTWLNPAISDGSMFQPALGHKIACIGQAQARLLESWGNHNKCEVVGLPRLDRYLGTVNSAPPRTDSEPFRLLVATATTPAFDEQQRSVVIQSLHQLKTRLENQSCEVTWRLTAGLEEPLELPPFPEDVPFEQALAAADAAIVTPSTMQLECMLQKLPTATLDFHQCPAYVPAAWQISSADHVEGVLDELKAPPAARMQYQNYLLHDHLECHSLAAPRMVQLIEAMVSARANAQSSGGELTLAASILDPERLPFRNAETGDQPAEVAELRERLGRCEVELHAAVKRLEELPSELARKRKQVVRQIEFLRKSREVRDYQEQRIAQLERRVANLVTRYEGES